MKTCFSEGKKERENGKGERGKEKKEEGEVEEKNTISAFF